MEVTMLKSDENPEYHVQYYLEYLWANGIPKKIPGKCGIIITPIQSTSLRKRVKMQMLWRYDATSKYEAIRITTGYKYRNISTTAILAMAELPPLYV